MNGLSRLLPLFVLALLPCSPAMAQTPRPIAVAAAPVTERLFLSGRGPADAVPWDFTVTGGRRAGEAATIPVPSNWEQHGFGTYDYGQVPTKKADEHGLYRHRFAAPDRLKGKRVRLVFEGVMTDATVKLNGRQLGPPHQGGFYRFSYDVTDDLKFGSEPVNLLEVDVGKASSDPDTQKAERDADYWVFGGIFRPVWLEAAPQQSIEHVAVDARADGALTADVVLAGAIEADRVEAQVYDAAGRPFGRSFSVRVPAGGVGRLRLAAQLDGPRLWTAETPSLYEVRLTLLKNGAPLHAVKRRFGFRTFEVRAGQGLYLNGRRILLKGVNRHSFRPESARALDREDSYEDVRLIRAMNMNAVRMSHYPPDEALLEAADELGLYVIDELSGWQHAHATPIGRRLVRSMIERDVNHPSILFWVNGNEGGFNLELDREFALHDPQNRPVLHPWAIFNDIDTKHYSAYADLTARLAGRNIVMPTEILHGLYDGGAGAGLDDYWKAITRSPVGGGAFLWVFADEGVVRTDQGNRIDVFSTHAPDGVVGPHHEKEGSFFTVRDVFSPVQIASPVLDAAFDGELQVSNRYDFTSLSQVGFRWRLLRFPAPDADTTEPAVLSHGTARGPAVAPGGAGRLRLDLPSNWRGADALSLTATGPDGGDLWTWNWPTSARGDVGTASLGPLPRSETASGEIRLTGGGAAARFDAATGLLKSFARPGASAALSNGPRLVFARPTSAGEPRWTPLAAPKNGGIARPAAPTTVNAIELELDFNETDSWARHKLEISSDGRSWRTLFDASRRPGDGTRYEFPPQTVTAVRVSGLRRPDGRPIGVKALRLGYAAQRFATPSLTRPRVTTGVLRDPASREMVAWLEARGADGLDAFRWTLHGDGRLRLDYSYRLDGEFLFHGVTFDHPLADVGSVRRLGEGPYRVWANRLRGTTLGVHEIARTGEPSVEARRYPEFEGYFAGTRWARFNAGAGSWTVTSASPQVYLRVGTPPTDHVNTTVDFPAGDISFLHAIPAMGSKFVLAADTGPESQPAKAAGVYTGSLTFEFASGPGQGRAAR